jgi:hypothetical protein
MARRVPSRTMHLQYVPQPDQERRLRQVFALLVRVPPPATELTTECQTGQRSEDVIGSAPATQEPKSTEGGNSHGHCPVCPCF